MKYDTLVSRVLAKGCKLDWTEEQFDAKYENDKTIIDIISRCGHKVSVQSSNFLYKDTGINCKSCVFKNDGISKRNNPKDTNMQEYQVIKAIQLYLTGFDFQILSEGCLADFAIKPVDVCCDKWLPIQLKTTEKNSYGLYGFSIKQDYIDMFVMLYCINDQRIWIINGNEINVNKINIGKKTSIYSKYELKYVDLEKDLLLKYRSSESYYKTLKELNTPRTNNQKNEQEFNRYREDLFPSIKFIYPEVNNRAYDCIINDSYKVQDKVITSYFQKKTNDTTVNRDKESYVVQCSRNQSASRYQYKLGDNDYYYFHLPNKTGAYVIPEQVMFANNLICKSDENKVAQTVSLYPYHQKEQLKKIKNAWMNDYLYFYEQDGVKQKIVDLFKPNGRYNQLEELFSRIVIS